MTDNRFFSCYWRERIKGLHSSVVVRENKSIRLAFILWRWLSNALYTYMSDNSLRIHNYSYLYHGPSLKCQSKARWILDYDYFVADAGQWARCVYSRTVSYGGPPCPLKHEDVANVVSRVLQVSHGRAPLLAYHICTQHKDMETHSIDGEIKKRACRRSSYR